MDDMELQDFQLHISVLGWSLVGWLNVALGVFFFGADVVRTRLSQVLDALTPTITNKIFPSKTPLKPDGSD